jgi:hypothetical protein
VRVRTFEPFPGEPFTVVATDPMPPIDPSKRVFWTNRVMTYTPRTGMDKLYAERVALAQELVQIRWKIEEEQARLTFLLHEMAKRKKGKKKPRY